MPTRRRWRQQTRCQAVRLVGLGSEDWKDRGGYDAGSETRTKDIDWGLDVGSDDAATRLGVDSAMGRDIGHSVLLKYFTKRVMREKRWGESAEHPLRIIIRMVRGLGRIISY